MTLKSKAVAVRRGDLQKDLDWFVTRNEPHGRCEKNILN